MTEKFMKFVLLVAAILTLVLLSIYAIPARSDDNTGTKMWEFLPDGAIRMNLPPGTEIIPDALYGLQFLCPNNYDWDSKTGIWKLIDEKNTVKARLISNEITVPVVAPDQVAWPWTPHPKPVPPVVVPVPTPAPCPCAPAVCTPVAPAPAACACATPAGTSETGENGRRHLVRKALKGIARVATAPIRGIRARRGK